MTVSPVLDAAGRRRSPATLPGYHAGRPPRNKGRLYPADPPTVEEIIAVMRQTGHDRHGSVTAGMRLDPPQRIELGLALAGSGAALAPSRRAD